MWLGLKDQKKQCIIHSLREKEGHSDWLQKPRHVQVEKNVNLVLGNHNWQALVLRCVPHLQK